VTGWTLLAFAIAVEVVGTIVLVIGGVVVIHLGGGVAR
jgi:hypothetical protein